MDLKSKNKIFFAILGLLVIGGIWWLYNTPTQVSARCKREAAKRAVKELNKPNTDNSIPLLEKANSYYKECLESKGYEIYGEANPETFDFTG